MEERTIKINIEKAREWYNSNLSSLKEVALQAFTKEELEGSKLEKIIETLISNHEVFGISDTQLIQLKAIQKRKDIYNTSAPKLLRIIATCFSGGFWRKPEGVTGYFFYKKNTIYNKDSANVLDSKWVISSHSSVTYPTLVYFMTEENCREAYNILKSIGKLDALYTDF